MIRFLLIPALTLGLFMAFSPPVPAEEEEAAARSPHLVVDLTPTPTVGGSMPRDFAVYRDRLYMSAYLGVTGRELWVSDGTEAGTELFLDLRPGPESSWPKSLTTFSDRLFFVAVDGVDREASLFSTDGTREGTARVRGVGFGSERDLLATADALFLVIDDAESGRELWTSDGTPAGTRRVRDIREGPEDSRPYALTEMDGKVYFIADDGIHGRELWRTDGTPEGTVLVYDVHPGEDWGLYFDNITGDPDGGSLRAVDGTLYFAADDGSGWRLWRTDGTAEGTEAVSSLGAGPVYPQEMGEVGSQLLFKAGDDLWSTSPANGNQLLLAGPLDVAFFTSVGERAFFRHRDGLGVTDGTVAGTRLVWKGSAVPLAAVGTEAFFSAGPPSNQLWRSNGDPDGTRSIRAVNAGPGAVFRGEFYFSGSLLEADASAEARRAGSELWKSDGTYAGTAQVRDLNPGVTSTHPRTFLAAYDRVLFSSNEGLWSSAGTAADTRLVRAEVFPTEAVALGRGAVLVDREGFLWWSDGTSRGTSEILSRPEWDWSIPRPHGLTVLGDRVLFAAATGTGYAIWSTDGTRAGTAPVAEVPELVFVSDPGMNPCFEPPPSLETARRSDGVVFVGHHDVVESDGTAGGTRHLATRSLGWFDRVAVAQDQILVVEACYSETRLLRLDGPGESVPLAHFAGTVVSSPLPGYFVVDRVVDGLTAVGDKVFFYASTPQHGAELWVSDGTLDGTRQVLDLRPGVEGSKPRDLVALGDRLLFSADDGVHGRELWTSDGTAYGTRWLRDIHPGSWSSSPSDLTVVDGRVVFSAADAAHGRELWVSDGTSQGTYLVDDLLPGRLPSSPAGFVAAGDELFLSAADLEHGVELWAMDRAMLAEGEGCTYEVSPQSLAVGAAGGGAEVSLAATAGCPWTASSAADWITVNTPSGEGDGNISLSIAAREETSSRTATVTFTGGATVPVVQQGAPEPPCAGCLRQDRFVTAVTWRDQRSGAEGSGHAVYLSDETVLFWFFNERNIELLVKILDGRRQNGHFWVFYGGLSDLEYWLTVTDRETGEVRTYHNPPGEICGQGDILAFPG